MWLVDAERTVRIAQALPGWTKTEVDETPGDELDGVIAVHAVYKAVEGARRREE